MTATVPAGSVVLDAPSWAVVCGLAEAAGVAVPPDFVAFWASLAGVDQGPARRRMVEVGLIEGSGALHPLLRALFARLGGAPVQVRARTAVGGRAVLAHFAADAATTVAVTCRQGFGPGGAGHGVCHAGVPGAVELASFATADLAEHLWRIVPPAMQAPSRTPGPGVELPWDSVSTLLHLVRHTQGIAAGVAAQVHRQVLPALGVASVPPVIAGLALPLAGAVEVSTVLLPGTAVEQRWLGLWLLTGEGRPVAVSSPQAPAAAGPAPSLRLLGGEGWRADIVRCLAEAFDGLTRAAAERGGAR